MNRYRQYFPGLLGQVLDAMGEQLERQRIVSTPSVRVAECGTNGTRLEAKGATPAKAASAMFSYARVDAVYPDHLVLTLSSDDSRVIAQKPAHLWVGSLPGFDFDILTAFQDTGDVPYPPYARGWFTTDYIMRDDRAEDQVVDTDIVPDLGGSWTGWIGSVQSRLRLVTAPTFDHYGTDLGGPGLFPPRLEISEIVWPPYRPTSWIGGIGQSPTGGYDTFPDNCSVMAASFDGGTTWHDMNVHARRWMPIQDVLGENLVILPDNSFAVARPASIVPSRF